MDLTSFRVVWIAAAVGLQFFEFGVLAEQIPSPFLLNPFLDMYAPLQTEKENPQCHAEARYFKEEASKLTRWALQMLDASSKIPSSFLTGNVDDLGNYDACLAIRSDGTVNSKQVIGQYCYVQVKFNSTRHRNPQEITTADLLEKRSWAVCMPAACNEGDLKKQIEFSLKDSASEVAVKSCKSILNDSGLRLSSWVVIILILAMLVFIFVATLIEIYSIRITHQLTKSVVLCFSLKTNVAMLLGSSEGQIDCLHGIRVFCMIAVLAFHFVSISSLLTINMGQAGDVSAQAESVYWLLLTRATCALLLVTTHTIQKPFESILKNGGSYTLSSCLYLGRVLRRAGWNALDAFLMMSGLLAARGFVAQKKARVSYHNYVMHRLLRVFPVYSFVILIAATLLEPLGSGPMWNTFMGLEKHACTHNWWKNLLFINNYAGVECWLTTWYLAVDMQLYLVTPIFLHFLCKDRNTGLGFMAIVIVASCLNTFRLSYGMGITYIVDEPVLTNGNYFHNLSMKFETRVATYLIGILFGYFWEDFKQNKKGISPLSQLLGWTLSITIMYNVLFYFPFKAHELGCGTFVFALFESLHHPLYAAAVGWIIFACEEGYAPAVNRFLSNHFFQILSRLSFSFYLTHWAMVWWEIAQRRTLDYFCWYTLLRNLVFDVVILNLVSAILFLMLECPFVRLSKLIFKREKHYTELKQ